MDLEFLKITIAQRRAEIAENRVNQGAENPIYSLHKLDFFFIPCPLFKSAEVLEHSGEINCAGKKGVLCFDYVNDSAERVHGVRIYYDRPIAFFMTHKAALNAQQTIYKRIKDTYIHVFNAGMAGNDFELLFDAP